MSIVCFPLRAYSATVTNNTSSFSIEEYSLTEAFTGISNSRSYTSFPLSTLSSLPNIATLSNTPYQYLDENGEEKTTTATVVEDSDDAVTWTEQDTNNGWYIVTSDVTISGRITCVGNIHLILADDVTLTADAGIAVNEDEGTLTIYAQSTDEETMGVLIATALGSRYNAGIGGDSGCSNGAITINGGNITAVGSDAYWSDDGVWAYYGGAGIGGGSRGDGKNITINGGIVTATAGTRSQAAGIGGGYSGDGYNISITGGVVTATGRSGIEVGAGAGIGGGTYGSGYNIEITGGIVNATGGSMGSNDGAGIGGGHQRAGYDITISGGTVTASSYFGAGIGGGTNSIGYNITISGGHVTAQSTGGYNVAIGNGWFYSGSSGLTDINIYYGEGGYWYRNSDEDDFTHKITTLEEEYYTISYLEVYPAAIVEYVLLSTDNPSDASTAPESVTSDSGTSYTIEDTLTTSETSSSNAAWFFNGWYYDEELTEQASGEIVLSGVTTLYGEWLTSEITLEKSSDATLIQNAAAGDTIDYMFKITNTGETTLTNITLYDEKLGGDITLEDTTLVPGESTTVSQTYTLTQDDIDAGSVTNTATATGEDPGGSSITDTDDVTVEIRQKPDINLRKTVDTYTVSDAVAGSTTINYTFVITNTGNVTLSNITLSDDMLGGSITLEDTTLAPGESTTASQTYTLTQDDIDSGSIYNTATVIGEDPGGLSLITSSGATVKIEQTPGIDLVKTANTALVEDAEANTSTINYTFTITNTGNVTLNNIALSDDMFGGEITLEDTTLAPGESTTASQTYTLTQSNINSGKVYNEATVTATPPSGDSVSATDHTTVLIEWLPALEIVKTSTSGTIISDATPGTVVTYEISVTNTGNVILMDINVEDKLDGASVNTSNLVSVLSPGESFTITADYTLTQEDIDRGYVYNSAVATGITPDGIAIAPVSGSETVELPSNPSIELVKTADVDIVESAATGVSTITYMFTVTNTGNTTLSNITLIDPLLGGDIELNETTLAPNASTFGTATYTVTQDDIDAGIVTNTATVTGDDPQGTSVSNDSTEKTDVEQLPAVDLVKEVVGDATIADAYAGDWIQFAITVTNTGNTTLSNVTITDLLEGAVFVVEELEGVTFNDDSVVVDAMLPGDTVTVYVDYQLTQSDIDRGDTENIANVTATPPGDLEEVSDDDDAVIETPSDPSISLTKTANVESVEFALPGDIIYYTLTITNTGNTTISNLTLYDDLLGGDVTESLDKTTIVPGESATALLSYTLTQDDINTGSVYNFATATGEDPNGTSVDSGDDYTVELIANPSVTLTKTVAAANDVANEDLTTGDELTYTLVIANNGNQTITDIILYDELLGGEIDLSNATKGIDMTVIGYIPTTNDETSVDDDVNVDTTSRVYYMEHATVSADDPTTTLHPGEYLLVELTYTITQDDMNNGLVDNTATVTAVDPNGNGISDADTATMYLPQHPEVELVKEVSQETLGIAEVGDLISYTLTITNTGDVPLTNITLVDELEGIIIDTGSLNGLTLDPGEAAVVTAEYALTEVDLETGSVYNHAVVTTESTVPYNESNTWSGAQQVSADDDALVDGIVATTSEPILSQTGGTSLIICGGILIGLAATTGIITHTVVGRRKDISIK